MFGSNASPATTWRSADAKIRIPFAMPHPGGDCDSDSTSSSMPGLVYSDSDDNNANGDGSASGVGTNNTNGIGNGSANDGVNSNGNGDVQSKGHGKGRTGMILHRAYSDLLGSYWWTMGPRSYVRLQSVPVVIANTHSITAMPHDSR